MKVFLSWSGTVSQQIAGELRGWLPLILPAVSPFITTNDIDKGARWFGEISKELELCNFGVMCLTRENLTSQWIAFESGALSKQLTGRVASILFGIRQADVSPPLAMFQNSLFTQAEIRQLVSSINLAVPGDARRDEAQLDTLFPMLWPRLEEPVNLILQNAAAASAQQGPTPAPDYGAMTEELLSLARTQAALLSSPERLLGPLLVKFEEQAARIADLETRFREREVRLAAEQAAREIEAQELARRVLSQARWGGIRRAAVARSERSSDPTAPPVNPEEK